ncbi:MAG: hypothetical protein U5L03_08775 [Burkholderiaceae bacterium]|nr:hypothetical protein [Burkholderiaceae bacterium]
MTRAVLLERLDAIGGALAARSDALGLLGLGSVGCDTGRLDAYSDLDFFVIVRAGAKARYIDALDWLAAAQPLVWHFRNTADGHKALMDDGVFCEFAVFEPAELERIAFAPGRWVWRSDELDARLAAPQVPLPPAELPDEAWLVGEILSNLLVGLQRLARGETLAAMRLIQVHAVDRVLQLVERRQPRALRDPFALERRIEQRQTALRRLIAAWAQGYAASPASALAILDWLQANHAVTPAVAAHIRALAGDAAIRS